MRTLHPQTRQIAAERDDIRKTVITNAWAEVFKWKGGNKEHPKMFIWQDFDLGIYMRQIYLASIKKGCNLDPNNVKKLGTEVWRGFTSEEDIKAAYFNRDYLISDACSLYYKGINIFPDIYGSDARKYIPVESHEEIARQIIVNKTLTDGQLLRVKKYLDKEIEKRNLCNT